MATTTQGYYDGKRIIPFGRISYSRNFNQTPDGTVIGYTYNITYTGTILPHKGSPDSNGDFWEFDGYPPDESIDSNERLSVFFKKQEALRSLFSKSNIGKKFEVIPEFGDGSFWFYPTSIEITFAEGPWFQTCDYTISMVADRLYPDVDGALEFNLESISETWAIETNEQQRFLEDFTAFAGGNPNDYVTFNNPFTYRITHSLSATGKKVYENGVANNPFQEARDWIASRTGIDNSIILSGFNNLDGMTGYNHVLSENIDKINNSYSVNENWLFTSGNVLEDYTVSTQSNINDGLTTVSIQGNIQGLELRVVNNVTQNKWDNASGYFNSILNDIPDRAQSFSNLTLNPIAISQSIGRNPLAGTISYAYEFNNRPSSLISGAKSENISLSFSNSNNLDECQIAIVPVIGRNSPYRGPVLQDLGTARERQKTLSIDFNLGPPSGAISYDFPYNLISGLINQLDPINNGANKSYVQQPQENWNPLTGIASYSITWVYEK